MVDASTEMIRPAAVVYRHWSFRRNVFRPDGPLAALANTDQLFLNGQPIPNDVVHGVRTFFGFGYIEIYISDSKGRVQLNERGDDVVSVRLWGRIALRPKLPDERWETK